MKKYIIFLAVALVILLIATNTTYEQQSIIPLLQTLLVNQPFQTFLSQFEFTYLGNTVSVETKGYFHFIEFLVRKATHFFGYGLIGLFMYMLFRDLKFKQPAAFSLLIVLILASLDEYNQSKTPGRTGAIQDVILDVAGALTCIIVAQLCYVVFQKRKK